MTNYTKKTFTAREIIRELARQANTFEGSDLKIKFDFEEKGKVEVTNGGSHLLLVADEQRTQQFLDGWRECLDSCGQRKPNWRDRVSKNIKSGAILIIEK
jgi:hypothetical protein